MTPTDFVSQLQSLRFTRTFNPYRDHCKIHDLDDAAAKRSAILVQMLEAALRARVDAIWVGRDLGYRGGRRCGLALTDDVHFHDHLARWNITAQRPTGGEPVSERTAAVIWKHLAKIDRPIFLWNVFPLHPHDARAPFTNRAHNAKERQAGARMLSHLIEMLAPKRLVAIGNDAEKVLLKIANDTPVAKVRHPSYGGQADFSKQVQTLYPIEDAQSSHRTTSRLKKDL